MWPPPVQRQADDVRWLYSGMAMQMAMHAGYHRVGYEHEYHAYTYSKSLSNEQSHTRVWRCWCFVNALLSCELGLPCLVPFDALEIKPGDEAALPADFISKLRIVFYISRINDTLGDNTCKDGSHRMRTVRLLEKDINSLVFGLRQSPTQWNPSVEFVHLSVLLNLYSCCLRWSSPVSINDPDHTIIQSSAAQAASQLIKLYSSSPSLINDTASSEPRPQRYYPKFYLRFNVIALLMLLKISVLNKISLRELGEVDDAIRLGHGALMSQSSSEGDEFHRAASVVEVLCKKGVIDSVRGKSSVESRFGASLWLELVATAIRWRRQNSKRGPRPTDGGRGNTDNNNDNPGDSAIPSSNMGRPTGSGDGVMSGSTAADSVDAARLTMADVQGNVNLFPFSIEDWSAYLDVTEADLGFGCESTPWFEAAERGGVVLMERMCPGIYFQKGVSFHLPPRFVQGYAVDKTVIVLRPPDIIIMSVVPLENTDKVELERLHDLAVHHEYASTVVEKDQKVQPRAAESPALPTDSDEGSTSLDHQDQTVWTLKTFLATLALAGLYVGSQIPLYFAGAVLSYVAADIGGVEASSWLSVAYALPLAAVAPFCGYLQDLLGRRNITLAGGVIIMMGCVIVATAHHFREGIVGMGFAGAGAAIGELSALAGTSELVPVNKRGTYLALVTGFVLPFTPYVIYAQLLAAYHTWRWGLWICLIWNGIWWLVLLVIYFPESQTRAKGRMSTEALKKIDYIGGITSVTGLTLILVALEAGGYSHLWKSAYILAQLLVGIALLVAFVVWEWKYCKEPMVPHELFTGQRIVAMALTNPPAGMNFYAMINFFPLVYQRVFQPDPVKVGLRGLGPGLSTTLGAVVANSSLSWFRGHNREILLAGCVIMTAFGGAFAAVTPDREALAIGLGICTGLGVGAVLVPAATVAITVAPDTSIATCVALSITIRAVGGGIGAAIYYNIFVNKLKSTLPAYVAQSAVHAGLPVAEAAEFVELFEALTERSYWA
ncbi:hypothetical protein CLAIMM_04831 isoform 1 [Cladophialophora immunda]|nr:hypothetical protein CLAIMM_04831 isoform 1 [Cladophialophora immunda]